jgi:hypothetical protein
VTDDGPTVMAAADAHASQRDHPEIAAMAKAAASFWVHGLYPKFTVPREVGVTWHRIE